MPSKSKKQAKLMRAVAHGWKPSRIKGPTRAVAKEFVDADKRRDNVTGYQFGGMAAMGPAYRGARGMMDQYRGVPPQRGGIQQGPTAMMGSQYPGGSGPFMPGPTRPDLAGTAGRAGALRQAMQRGRPGGGMMGRFPGGSGPFMPRSGGPGAGNFTRRGGVVPPWMQERGGGMQGRGRPGGYTHRGEYDPRMPPGAMSARGPGGSGPFVPGGDGLPPGVDPRAVAANPEGYARQQAEWARRGVDEGFTPGGGTIGRGPGGVRYTGDPNQMGLMGEGPGGRLERESARRMAKMRGPGRFPGAGGAAADRMSQAQNRFGALTQGAPGGGSFGKRPPGRRIAPPPGKYPGGGNPMTRGRNPMMRGAGRFGGRGGRGMFR